MDELARDAAETKPNRGDAWTQAEHFVSNGPYKLVEWRFGDRIRNTPPAGLPTGTIFIWESKYADLAGFTQDLFTRPDSGWKEDAIFGDGTVRVFEKTGP